MDHFVSYKDLPGLGIRVSYAMLISWMDRGLFPPAVRITPGRVGWRASEVQRYIDADVPSWATRPQLWPIRQGKPTPPGPKRGRQPGSRIVIIDGLRRVVQGVEAAD